MQKSELSAPGVSVEEQLKILLQKSMSGDTEAYERFLLLSSALIRRYLTHLGGRYVSAQTVEDLSQEVLLSVHQKKHTYTWDRPLLPWLYAVTRYRYIDHYRQQKRAPQLVELSELYANTEDEGVRVDWEELLGLLNPKQRDMFTLIKVEGQSYAKVAKDLNMSVPSVKVSIHRMMKTLKDKVQK